MLAKSDEYVQKAYDKLVDISADKEKRLEYEAREKAIRDHNFLMTTNLEMGRKAIRDYSNIISSGWVRGHEQGKKYGIQQGLQEGLQQGICALIEACQELGLSYENTHAKVLQKFSLTEKDTQEYMKKYWKAS